MQRAPSVHARAETEWQKALELEKKLKAASRCVGDQEKAVLLG